MVYLHVLKYNTNTHTHTHTHTHRQSGNRLLFSSRLFSSLLTFLPINTSPFSSSMARAASSAFLKVQNAKWRTWGEGGEKGRGVMGGGRKVREAMRMMTLPLECLYHN